MEILLQMVNIAVLAPMVLLGLSIWTFIKAKRKEELLTRYKWIKENYNLEYNKIWEFRRAIEDLLETTSVLYTQVAIFLVGTLFLILAFFILN